MAVPPSGPPGPPGPAAAGRPDSWYAATAPGREPRPALAGREAADVCVVGAGFTGVSADAPGRRQVDVVTTSQCDTCEVAKDRPPVISGAGARCAAMLRQPAPQRTSALGCQRVGSYPRNPGATFRSVPCFADFPERIHPSFRPVHIAIAIGQNARAADAGLKLAEKPVEANGVGEAVSHGGIYRAMTIACPGSSEPSEQSRSGPDHATRVPEIGDNLGRLER